MASSGLMTSNGAAMASAETMLEDKLKEVGSRLTSPPSNVDELLSLLDQTECLLSRVQQSPPQSMSSSMLPIKYALVTRELLENSVMDVRVSVASCISEITRITAPDASYDDDLMKEIFRVFVDAFKDLDDISSPLYPKKVSILENVAQVGLCVLMLDLDCDNLILQMFQHFLKTIRSKHATNVFSSMETIMTLALEEAEDVPEDLLVCLLNPLEKGNKDVLPIARRLAEKVIVNCALKLRPYYLELRSRGASFSDCSNILASICQQNSGAPESEVLNVLGECLVSETQYGENLVGSPIKIWWPADQMFYPGVVVSFDPVSKKHKIIYDDGDVEKLLLAKERWEFVEDDSKTKWGQAKDFPNHGSCPEVMANHSTRNVKSKQGHEQWSPEETRELLRLLVKEVKNGQRLENGCFRKETIMQIVLPNLNAKFGNKKEYKHVQDKLRIWREMLEPVKEIASSVSGLGWDPVTQRFMATDEVWEKIKKVHPNASSFRDKVFEDYKDLRMVVGRHFAVVKEAGGDNPLTVDKLVGKSLDAQELNEDIGFETACATPVGTLRVAGLPTDTSQASQPAGAPQPNQACNISSKPSRRKRKAATTNSASMATTAPSLDAIAEGLCVLGNALQCLTAEIRYIKHRNQEWKEAINSTPGLTDDMRWKALELSTTQEMKETFVSMSYKQRQRWLYSKFGG